MIAFVMWASISTPILAQTGSLVRTASPILEIPSEGPGYRFSVIGAIERLADGRFAVLEAADRRVLVFDSTGRHVRSLGGNGDGPGEFRWPQSMGLRGDSLWVGDATHRRITTFNPGMEVAATQAITSSGVPSRTARGGVVILSLLQLSSTRAQSRTVVTNSGSTLDTVVSVPYPAHALLIKAGSMALLMPQPFSDAPLVQVGRDGRGVVTVLRSTSESGPRAVHVRKAGLDGARGFDVRLPYAPEEVAQARIDAEVTRIGDILQRRMPNESRGEIDRRTRSALYIPEHAPTVSAVSTGEDGYTWLRRVGDGRSPVTWTVLDQDGKVAYEVSLPQDAKVLWSSDDVLATTRKDEDGVPRIVVYRMHGRGTSRSAGDEPGVRCTRLMRLRNAPGTQQ